MISARFVASPVTHSFKVNDVLMQVIGPCNVTQYLVEEVISSSKIRVFLYLSDGSLSSNSRCFEDKELKYLIKNTLATNLLDSLYQETLISA